MSYCSNCGAPYPEGAVFCPVCGAPTEVPAAVTKTPWKQRILGFVSGLLVVALIFCVGLLFFREGETPREQGYDSPEEAATAYLEALRDLDVKKALSSFASVSYVEAMIEGDAPLANVSDRRELGAYAVEGLQQYAANYYYARNVNFLRNTYLTLAKEPEDVFYRNDASWLWENFSVGQVDSRISGENAETLAEYLSDEKWSKMLSTLKIGEFVSPEDYLGISSSEYRSRMDEFAEYMNAEAMELVIVEVDIGDYELYFTIDTACFDGKWYNLGMCYATMGANTTDSLFTFR